MAAPIGGSRATAATGGNTLIAHEKTIQSERPPEAHAERTAARQAAERTHANPTPEDDDSRRIRRAAGVHEADSPASATQSATPQPERPSSRTGERAYELLSRLSESNR